jgi:hypothetical protein
MTFAYGVTTQRRVISALANLRNFQGNERHDLDQGLTGLMGPYSRMLGAQYGALPPMYARYLDEAEYVVYCYGTPIAWVVNPDGAQSDGDLPRVNYLPDWQYSATTTYYQGLVRRAWGGEVVNPNPQQTAREMRDRRNAANAVRRANRRAAEADRLADRLYQSLANHQGMSPADRLQQLRRAEGDTQAHLTRAQLLDPRLADPDWVPGRGYVSRRDTDEIEQRDWERLRSEGRTADRYPHP